MPVYKYEIQESNGNIVSGTVEAVDEHSIVSNFKSQGYMVISIEEEKENILDFDLSKYVGGVSFEEIINFTMQLSTMLDSGITLLDALDILADQMDNKIFKNTISSIIQDIQNGMMFYEALERHPKIFSNFYINMIKIGETGGILEEILVKVTQVMENEQALKQEVKSALTYPIVLITVGVGVVVFLVSFVLPKFTALFASKHAALPLPTQLLLGFSKYFSIYIKQILISTFAFMIILYLLLFKTDKGRFVKDYIAINIPIFGILIKKTIIARFSLLLSALLKSGISFLDAIEVVQKILNNKIIEESFTKMKMSIQSGSNISDPLAQTGIFPKMVIKMVKVGEQSGNLDNMLEKLAVYYEREVKIEIKKIISLIEPMMIIVLSVIVGFILLSVFLPLLNMSKAFK